MKTKRLTGRPLTEADIPFVMKVWNDERVTAIVLESMSEQDVRDRIERWSRHRAAYGCGTDLFFDRSSAQPVGWGGLQHSTIGIGECVTIGYAIAPDMWGRGYATEMGMRRPRVRPPRSTRSPGVDPRDQHPVAQSRREGRTIARMRDQSRRARRGHLPRRPGGVGFEVGTKRLASAHNDISSDPPLRRDRNRSARPNAHLLGRHGREERRLGDRSNVTYRATGGGTVTIPNRRIGSAADCRLLPAVGGGCFRQVCPRIG